MVDYDNLIKETIIICIVENHHLQLDAEDCHGN